MIPIARPETGEDEVRAVSEVIRSGMLASGPKVAAFEEAFAAYCGTKHAVTTCNGTASLYVGMLAAGIGRGDEVIVPAFTFFATASSVSICGAKPVFADVDPRTYCIDPDSLLEQITGKTKAVMGVHLFGQPFNVGAIQEICDDHDLLLFEDAAQAHGAEYKGRQVGGLGTFGSFSFYPTKNMTTGEGGMITTNDPEIAHRARLLVNHGQSEKYLHTLIGFNLRMTDIGAAIGLVQLNKLEKYNEARISNARYYNEHLRAPGLVLPLVAEGARHVYHQYVVQVTGECPLSRDELMAYLREHGVGTAIHYPIALPEQPVYQQMYNQIYHQEYHQNSGASCPISSRLAGEVFSLPVHPGVTQDDLRVVAELVNGVPEEN
jgi:perosamine synthetase